VRSGGRLTRRGDARGGSRGQGTAGTDDGRTAAECGSKPVRKPLRKPGSGHAKSRKRLKPNRRGKMGRVAGGRAGEASVRVALR
jgi:hypothetical protein